MSKKKIGLLSVYNHNYGSILQASAIYNSVLCEVSGTQKMR